MRKFMITKRDARIFIPSFLALFASAYSITMLFPFLPFMIEFLLPRVKEEDIGKYAGTIASSLFLGRVFGSYVWGAVSDKKGRKPVVVVSCLLIGIFSAAFGFSVKIYTAIIFRFLVGLFNGVVGTVKAIISESSSNRTQALGMTLIMSSYSLGLVIGPAVSGALADPIGQYNLTISNPIVRQFLTKFPYSLPCLVNMFICVLAAVVVAVWMPETLGARRSEDGELVASGKSVTTSSEDQQELLLESLEDEESNTTHVGAISNIRTNGAIGVNVHVEKHGASDSGNRHGIQEEAGDDTTEIEFRDEKKRKIDSPAKNRGKRRGSLVPFFNRRSSFTPSFFKPSRSPWVTSRRQGGVVGGGHRSDDSPQQRLVFEEEEEEEGEEEGGEEEGEEREEGGGEVDVTEKPTAVRQFGQGLKKTLLNLKLFLTTRETLLSVLIYCTSSFAIIGFDEVYSLWAAAAPHLGGLGWTLHEIGISLAIAGGIFLPFSFIFPVLERRFGLINVYQMSCIVTIICIVMLPNIHLVTTGHLNPLRWFFVIMLLFIARVTIGSVFAATALFINNSVVFNQLGEVNGLAHSLTGALRTISPVFSGSIFSLSLSKEARHVGFPVDYHLIFIIFGVTMLCCMALGAGLPASINRQKVVASSSDSSESINRSESSLLIRTTDDTDSPSSHETKL